MNSIRSLVPVLGLAAAVALSTSCTRVPPGTYATPEEAVKALGDLAGSGDDARATAMFGPSGLDILRSGDPADDREDALKVKALIAEKVAFEDDGEARKIAALGHDAWPFPIPLVLENGRWRFDVEAGKEEILNRRIGRNELLAIESLRAYVDAQRDYASQGRDGKAPAFARRIRSSEGQHDGLYWAAAEGEAESPLGPLVAEAAEGATASSEERLPFNGYYFRILEAQGANAPGGAKSYVDANGLMTGGHAILAWPAKHGNSGVMSFQVGAQGIVFQKDLGADTATAVQAIQAFDPDESWTPTRD